MNSLWEEGAGVPGLDFETRDCTALHRRNQTSVVVLQPEVRDQVLAHDVAQRVLQLHRLDEQIVLRIEPLGRLRRLEVEAQPLLNADGLRSAGVRLARSRNSTRSSAIGAARIESRHRKFTLICIG